MPRDIPAPLLAHFKSSYRSTCFCWAIKPQFGDWEGYTSLDRDLVLPSYNTAPSDVPALTYLSAGGVSSTTIPARLNLSESGVDVAVLAFDRGRLLSGYYRGALFECFVLNYRDPSMGHDVVLSGKIGKANVGQLEATVELVTWAALSEQAIGRSCTALCDVGIYPGEKWGTKRCRNVTLNDGPDRDDWTALATVVSAASRHQLRVSWNGVALARSGNALPGAFNTRLEEGDVEFYASDLGGLNIGVERSIKSFTAVTSTSVDLVLHEELPFVPTAGDKLYLVAGCKKTAGDCKFYDNFSNFQGFPYVPLKSGVLNRKDAGATGSLPPVEEVTS